MIIKLNSLLTIYFYFFSIINNIIIYILFFIVEYPHIKKQKHSHIEEKPTITPKSPTFTDDETCISSFESKRKNKKNHHHKHSSKKKKENKSKNNSQNQNTKSPATPKLKRTKYIPIDENDEYNLYSIQSSNYIRTTPKIENRYDKKINDSLLNELNDTQFSQNSIHAKKENNDLESDSLKGIYSIFDNDSLLDSINLDDEDEKSFLGTPNAKNMDIMNDNELFSSPLIVNDPSTNHNDSQNIHRLDSKDDPESFDYGSDTIDYAMVKENHIITQACQFLNEKNKTSNNKKEDKSIENDSINIPMVPVDEPLDEPLDDSLDDPLGDHNIFDQKEISDNTKDIKNNTIDDINNDSIENKLFDQNPFKIESQLNDLTNLYNEFNDTMLSSNNNKISNNSVKSIRKQKSDLDSDFGLVLNEIIDQDNNTLFDDVEDVISEEIIKKNDFDKFEMNKSKNIKKGNKKLTVTFKDENDYIVSNHDHSDSDVDVDVDENSKNELFYNDSNKNDYAHSLINENSLPMPPMVFENNSINDKFDLNNDSLAQPPLIFENHSELENYSIEELTSINNIHKEPLSNKLNTKTTKINVVPESLENKVKKNSLLNDKSYEKNKSSKPKSDHDFIGFKTGSGKKLPTISNKLLLKAKELLGDDIFEDLEEEEENNKKENKMDNKNDINDIDIDDIDDGVDFAPDFKIKEFIENNRKLSQMIDNTIVNTKKALNNEIYDISNKSNENNKTIKNIGCETENRKYLSKLSNETVVNSKKILKNDLFDNMSISPIEDESKPKSKSKPKLKPKLKLKTKKMEFTGFKTGNGKELPILSDEAIANAKKLLGEDLFDDNNLDDIDILNNESEVKQEAVVGSTGFKTGNGKELPKLSDEAIAKSKQVLGDILFDDMNNDPTINNKPNLKSEITEFTGFKTGNGKKLPEISNEAIAKAKKLLGDDLFDDMNNVNVDPNISDKPKIKSETTEFTGFKTGNGKQMPEVSNKAIAKAKELLDDDFGIDEIQTKSKHESIGFTGFMTGNGKKMPKLSDEAIANAKKLLGDDLFGDIDNMNIDYNINDKPKLKSEATEFTGFKTGNGKQMPELSDEAIAIAKKLLGDDFGIDDIQTKIKNETVGFTGFMTGNGKQMPKLSDEAITKAKKLLGDDLFDDMNNMNIDHNINDKPKLKYEATEFTGFKTGNGKQMPKLSDEVITKAKKLLGDDLFDDMNNMNIDHNINDKPKLKSEATEFTGFKTGNGKQMPKLSDEAIANAKKLLGDDLFDDMDNMNIDHNINDKPKLKSEATEFTGFKTGNGKQMPKLSNEAIAKAKKLLGDDLFDENNIDIQNKEAEVKQETFVEFAGFKTGKGNNLPKLSDEAIENVKKMLGDDLFNNETYEKENTIKLEENLKEKSSINKKPISNPSVRIINNKIHSKIHNINKENKENSLNKTIIKTEKSINNFSRKFMNNKKAVLHNKLNDDKNILRPLHSINNSNSNVLKPKSNLM